MTDDALLTRPPNSHEKALRAKFAESYAGQSEQMDRLARQLITLELAVPGIYAAALKLVQGEDATLPVNGWLVAAFGCWSLALLLTLVALFPRRWKVDPTLLKPTVAKDEVAKDEGAKDEGAKEDDSSGPLSLEEFFYESARYKWRLLLAAIVFFWLGIVAAVLVVL